MAKAAKLLSSRKGARMQNCLSTYPVSQGSLLCWGQPVLCNILGIPWGRDLAPTLEAAGSQEALGKNPPTNAGDMGSIPGSGRSPRGGHGNPLQYSFLKNPMDGGAW